MTPDKQPAGETFDVIADRVAGFSLVAYHDNPDAVRAQIKADVLSALRNERERNCRLLCEWCGNDEYDLVWHHQEWRHYRKPDMHVEYCKAEVLRSGKGK